MVITKSQHGFQKKNSTFAYLTRMITTIQHQIANKQKVAGLFLDLQKAFDSIWHDGMLYRLREIGVTGKFLSLIQSFLKDRLISLTVNKHTSPGRPCKLGLPQGSVLSPLLFIIYIRDMLHSVEGLSLQFADDSTVITSAPNHAKLQQVMEKNCESISSWLYKWRIAANGSKSDLINFNSDISILTVSQEVIRPTNETRVLGITVDKDLRFKTQHQQAKVSLKRKWGMIKPLLSAGLTAKTAKTILMSVIIPAACHGSHLWDSSSSISIYTEVKEMLRIPFNPPVESLFLVGNITPVDVNQSIQRMIVIHQLVSSGNLATLVENNKSKLQKVFLTDIRKLLGRHKSFSTITKDEVGSRNLRRYRKEETRRKGRAFIQSKQGYDGLLYHLEPQLILKYPVPLTGSPRMTGTIASLFTGHCSLGLHKYNLGVTYTPTCACLNEDETVMHHVFRCALHSCLREDLKLTESEFTISKLVNFCTQTRRFIT